MPETEYEAREAARKAALEEARELAQSQQQARIKAENEAREAEIQRRKKLTSEMEDAKRKIAADIEQINIGGLINFYDDKGEFQQLKLAVKLQSSGKFVFVDRAGIKRKETIKEDLLKMLEEGCAQIIDSGTYFENSLEKVVNGLRKGRKD